MPPVALVAPQSVSSSVCSSSRTCAAAAASSLLTTTVAAGGAWLTVICAGERAGWTQRGSR